MHPYPVADAKMVADKIPGAQYAEVSAAHLSNVEARDEFNHQVLTFLSD
jgi:3-oxoadipate enol-lactonase